MPYPRTDYLSQFANLGAQVQNVGIAADKTAEWVRLQRELKDFAGLKKRYIGEVTANIDNPKKREYLAMQIKNIKKPDEFLEKVAAYESARQDWKDSGIEDSVPFGVESKVLSELKQNILNRRGQKQAQEFIGSQLAGDNRQENFIRGQAGLSPEASAAIPPSVGQYVTKTGEAEAKRAEEQRLAAEQSSLTQLQEMELTGGIGGTPPAETQQEAYGRLGKLGVEKPTPTIISYIGTMPKTKQEKQEQEADIEKKETDLRAKGTGDSDDLVKANAILTRRQSLENSNKRLLPVLKKAVLLTESNDTEKLMLMKPELDEAGYEGSIEPTDLQNAYEDAVKVSANMKKSIKQAEETVKIIEKRGSSALARASGEAGEQIEREAQVEKATASLKEFLGREGLRIIEMPAGERNKILRETLSAQGYTPDVISQVLGGGSGMGGTTGGGVVGGQYPNATSAIINMYKQKYGSEPSQGFIQKQLDAWKSKGIELD
jgi:hypothetical protein